MRHFDSDTLAALVAVADFGSFTAAAEHLGKTQAAVSMAVARLEERLGKKLFERGHRRVTATVTGECLIGYARQIQTIEAEALEAVADRVTESRVRLGMPDDFVGSIGEALLHRFSPQNRALYIDLTCDFSRKLRLMMNNGELDVAIVTQAPEDPPDSVFRYERQVWCTGPNGHPEDEEVLRLAMFSDDCSARPRVFATLDRAERPWRLAHTSSHVSGIHLAVASGSMLTVLPESAVPAGWRCLGEADGLPALPALPLVLLVSRSERLAARQLAAFLRREFARAREPGVETVGWIEGAERDTPARNKAGL
ncbi:DNA-binding transcriptional regulator, LysR family [Pseudoxanthobacter soli DSM 19599]|uniref:DNA-binding transcriptional regulator, LysR family n=1 Tax=Pseudoxanthobacter soli DSM 19599 TaxID=1123029 RepID=A0A1M7ZF70_9HYPH|nr:LysR family transcriptional regulator [Pseudoxanthobacter soli]SHO63555.1 DNA-binding transcriptional regulator, LysR family [Pseudoxanthobacter soli DSM 19599]